MLIDWLSENNAQLNVAMNISIASGMLLLVTIVFWHWNKLHFSKENSLSIVLLGVIIEAIGWTLNRLWWAFAWWAEDHNWTLFNADSELNWISLIPLMISMVGLVFIISPLLMKKNDTNYMRPMIILLAGFSFIFTLSFLLMY